MPGKKITDHQVQKYKQHRLKLSQVAAAAKTGARAPEQEARLDAGGERLLLAAPGLVRLKAQDAANDLKTGAPLRYGKVLPARFDLAADAGAAWPCNTGQIATHSTTDNNPKTPQPAAAGQ